MTNMRYDSYSSKDPTYHIKKALKPSTGNKHLGEILENGLLVAKSYSVEKFELLST